MKFTDKAKMKEFVEKVKAGAPAKSFRTLGLGPNDIKHHLGFLTEYEKVLLEPEKKSESLIVKKKLSSSVSGAVKNKETEVEEEKNESGVRLRDTEEL